MLTAARAARHGRWCRPAERFGSKGAALFARVEQPTSKFDLRLHDGGKRKAGKASKASKASKAGKAGELLGTGSLCVIPPTLHPDTGQPYRWIGAPLLEVGWQALPLVEVKSSRPCSQRHLAILMGGEETHDAALSFVASWHT